MASAQKEKDLQDALMQAVFYGYLEPVVEAGKALNEHFFKTTQTTPPKPKLTGRQVLDFVYEGKKIKDMKKSLKFSEEFLKLCTHSPLMMAVQLERMEIVEKLKELGASMAFKNKDGLSALHIACNKCNKEMARLLLETAQEQQRFCSLKKNRRKKTRTEGATETDEMDAQEEHPADAMEAKSDITVLLNAKEKTTGWTALMYAAKHGDLKMIELLTSFGLDQLCLLKKSGNNVYHVLAREPTSLKEEVEGVSDAVEAEGSTAKDKRMKKQLECLQYLQSLELEGNTQLLLSDDKDDRNILHMVCHSGNLLMLKWLLENHFDQLKSKLSQKTKQLGYTPLLYACQYSKHEIVEYLTTERYLDLVDVPACCLKKRNGGACNQNGLHFAVIHNDKKMVELLVKAGCPLDVKDEEGNTILHVANMNSSFSVTGVIKAECKNQGIDLDVENDKRLLPRQVEGKYVIPPEIEKLGEKAVEIYLKALRDGTEKLPYCSLLILGRQEVGKTSLYHQLVGIEFMREMVSTRGISNKTIDTMVDRRTIGADTWKEKEDEDTSELLRKVLKKEVAGALGDQSQPGAPKPPKPPSKEELLRRIRAINNAIMEAKKPAMTAVVDHDKSVNQRPPLQQSFLPSEPPVDRVEPEPKPESERFAPQSQPPPLKKPKIKEAPMAEPEAPTQPALEIIMEVATVVSAKPSLPSPKQPSPTQEEMDVPVKPPSDQEPVVEVRPAEQQQTIGISRRGSRQIALAMTQPKQQHDKPPVPLSFNMLDFAGQPMYRPMHHCFISRRAVYLVVFKIPDMLEYIKNPQKASYDPISDIRYWVQSIHAHIHPPDFDAEADCTGEDTTEDSDEKYKKVRRVVLVGTHRGVSEQLRQTHFQGVDEVIPLCSDEDLKKIDDLISKELIYPENNNHRCVKHINPIKKSLCKFFIPVENSIDIKAQGDQYLNESGTQFLQSKIKMLTGGLKFLDEDYPIKWLDFEGSLKRWYDKYPVMTLDEVHRFAIKSGINEVKDQDLALKFFHDSGKIICLKYLPRLFLKDDERRELQNLVVVHPDWLVSAMKEIMELEVGGDEDEENDLQQDPVKVSILVKEGVADIELLKCCWKEFLTPDNDTQFRQLRLILQAHCLIYPFPGFADSSSSTFQKFIIPCKLKEDPPEYCFKCSTFFFDFYQFLPDEIYHRLICRATARIKDSHRCQQFSRTRCIFHGLDDTTWVMELDTEKQRLKISVAMKKDPVDYIDFIHQELHKICDDSNLKGLVYSGGPEVTCDDCKSTSVLRCVKYRRKDVKDTSASAPVIKCYCPSHDCKEYDVNELLMPRKSTSPQDELELKDLKDVLNMVVEAADSWNSIALELEIHPSKIKTVKADNPLNVTQQLTEILELWLSCNGGQRSWTFLRDAMESNLVKKPDIAKAIEKKYILKV